MPRASRPKRRCWSRRSTRADHAAFRRAFGSGLRTRQRDVALGAKDIGVEVGDPLPAGRGHVEIAYLGLDVRRDALPIELRIPVDDVGRRVVAELSVDADLLELI